MEILKLPILKTQLVLQIKITHYHDKKVVKTVFETVKIAEVIGIIIVNGKTKKLIKNKKVSQQVVLEVNQKENHHLITQNQEKKRFRFSNLMKNQ